MTGTRESIETQLNDLDPKKRKNALDMLCDMAAKGAIVFPEPGNAVNLHCHTSFSYNGYGYSPSFIPWRARCEGLLAVGCVDFDVLDAVDEFLAACRTLGIRGCAGLETRVFIPSFATREINSPGEPGIAYYMGVGYVSSTPTDHTLLGELKAMAQQRNRGIMERVNAYLGAVSLDYDRDVAPLTPKGNATERHLCMAYDAKSREVFPDADRRAAFWAEKLGVEAMSLKTSFADPPTFQGVIRAKTMKAGGPGYVKPEGPDFPSLERLSAFALDMGAIPTYAWLDGTTPGEQDIEALLGVAEAHGAAALNIIPDRYWNIKDPVRKRTRVDNLYAIVELAQKKGLPIVAGTEMNAYGQKFVDDFDAPELQPVVSAFVEGAYILYAHTALQAKAGMGYLSAWARERFASTKAKNAFFLELGKRLDPTRADALDDVTSEDEPDEIISKARSS